MRILYERDNVRVSMSPLGERYRLSIDAPGYVPFREIDTSYPVPLIERMIEVKGPIWFADEIAREEDPAYVQRTIKWGTLPFVDPTVLETARILDFGCGSGASTTILARTYPNAEVIGVELDPALVEIAQARAEFYRLENMTMHTSPSPDGLPEGLGQFDVVNLSAVLEHLLPDERKVLLPMLWGRLKAGGHLFLYETPQRYFPIEGHTTGLPLINYLPRRLAHAVVKVAARPEWRNKTWPELLRAGIRGATAREVLHILGASARLLPPSRMNVADRLQLWHAKASEGKRPQRSKDAVYHGLRAIRAVTGIEMIPELSIALRRADVAGADAGAALASDRDEHA